MATPFCEVIGCGEHAAWVLMASSDTLEEYLCDFHYQDLQRQDPVRAADYMPLSAIVSEE